jgi:hypothetical protein
MIIFSILSAFGSILYMQYFEIKDGQISVKSLFGLIIKLNLNDCSASIEILPTYFSWVMSINKKWICIYSTDEYIKFQSGCSNSKKHRRIQIFYSEKNYEKIKKYISVR